MISERQQQEDGWAGGVLQHETHRSSANGGGGEADGDANQSAFQFKITSDYRASGGAGERGDGDDDH